MKEESAPENADAIGKTPPTIDSSGRELVRHPLEFLMALARDHGDIVQYRAMPEPAFLLNHPDYIKHVLQTNARNYNKDTYFNKIQLQTLVGQGLITSENPLWRKQRRLMQPAFHRSRLGGFADMMVEATQHLLARWDALPGDAPELDVAAEMMRLTLDVVTQALFGYDIRDQAEAVGTAIEVLIRIAKRRHRLVQEQLRLLDEIVYGIIDARRRQEADQGDLLSMLMLSRYEDTGEAMDDRQVRDEVMSLLIAGHETTANTLSWLWYLLALHPDVAAQMEKEFTGRLGSAPPTMEDFRRLPYTYRVVQEAMRLYPSAWSISRRALGDDLIDGFHIPAGAIVAMSPYTMHRHPAFWPDPECFDPERFLPDRAAERPHFSYFPFGGGARQCIGNDFAMMENMLIVPTIMQRYRMHLVPGHPVEPHVLATLRPRYGIKMTLERRA